MQSSIACLVQSGVHDFTRNALNLDIHLQRGNSVVGTSNLEVHITEVILIAEDVGQDRKIITLFDQAHCNTGNRRFHRNASVHECEAGATNGSHRAGAIRFRDFRNDTNNVGEIVKTRHNRLDTTASQLAMANLTTLRRTNKARFTDAKRREVVMQHEWVFTLTINGVDYLGVSTGTQCCRDDCLCFTSGEDS